MKMLLGVGMFTVLQLVIVYYQHDLATALHLAVP